MLLLLFSSAQALQAMHGVCKSFFAKFFHELIAFHLNMAFQTFLLMLS